MHQQQSHTFHIFTRQVIWNSFPSRVLRAAECVPGWVSCSRANTHTGAKHIKYTHPTGSYFAAAHNLWPTTHFSHANELPGAVIQLPKKKESDAVNIHTLVGWVHFPGKVVKSLLLANTID